jgi:hypothetical protein
MSPTETVRTFYAALGRGDASAALTLLSDKLEWTEADGFPYFSGTWRTPQEVLENLFVPLLKDWETFQACCVPGPSVCPRFMGPRLAPARASAIGPTPSRASSCCIHRDLCHWHTLHTKWRPSQRSGGGGRSWQRIHMPPPRPLLGRVSNLSISKLDSPLRPPTGDSLGSVP